MDTFQIHNNRFKLVRKLADTNQGEIWRAQDLNDNNRSVVIKITFKSLVIAGTNTHGHHVAENIINEIKTLKHLTNQRNRDDGFCYLIDDWTTDDCFFYAMEFCQAELFQFISNAFTQNGVMHNFILSQQTQPQIPCDTNNKHEWLHKVRMMFRQMVKCVHWMHSKGVCHLDLSLENTLIYNINSTLCWGYCRTNAAPNQVPSDIVRLCLKFSNLHNKIAEFNDSRIKIIDFGVSKYFSNYEQNKIRSADLVNGYIKKLLPCIDNIDPEIINCCIRFHGGLQKFSDDKRCGKIGYMSPEVYSRQVYDSRKADIWTMGIILFMMSIGAPPYKRPTRSDVAFNYIIHGRIEDVLRHWRRLNIISTDVLDLMKKIFKYETDRISMEELIRHPFVDLIDELSNGKQRKLICVTQQKRLVNSNTDSKYDDDENMNDYDGKCVKDKKVVMEDGIDVENTDIQMGSAVMSIDDLIQTFSK